MAEAGVEESFAHLHADGNNFAAISWTAAVKFGGQGVINDTGVASNFTYLGLPTNTKVDYAGGSSFVGTINAPQAAVGTSGSAGFYGAIIANSFSATGGSNFHYDEALGLAANSGSSGILTLTSYREL
ncbi:MAG: hypothetical protein EPO07_09730 [Verrucomicrobia bacterium]|nr:MAG: hypothetical protein EPO07_09730 [Verrucomicrobiota bacterium]